MMHHFEGINVRMQFLFWNREVISDVLASLGWCVYCPGTLSPRRNGGRKRTARWVKVFFYSSVDVHSFSLYRWFSLVSNEPEFTGLSGKCCWDLRCDWGFWSTLSSEFYAFISLCFGSVSGLIFNILLLWKTFMENSNLFIWWISICKFQDFNLDSRLTKTSKFWRFSRKSEKNPKFYFRQWMKLNILYI